MEYISLFVKSIFVDNMIFAYFLGNAPKKECCGGEEGCQGEQENCENHEETEE